MAPRRHYYTFAKAKKSPTKALSYNYSRISNITLSDAFTTLKFQFPP